VKAETTA
jgi:hypothetical protein